MPEEGAASLAPVTTARSDRKDSHPGSRAHTRIDLLRRFLGIVGIQPITPSQSGFKLPSRVGIGVGIVLGIQ